MIKVLVACPDPSDPTSYYRGMGPWSEVCRYHPVSMMQGGDKSSDYEWQNIKQADCFFLQRPIANIHLDLIDRAKKVGRPVWIDYDDLLTEVPKDNPAYRTYSSMDARRTMASALAQADLVTVSTVELAQALGGSKKIRVIPNCFDDTTLTMKEIKPRSKIILWRGSDTHVRDLQTVQDQILKISEEFQEWTFMFVGYDPYFITDRMRPGSYRVARPGGVMEYMHFMGGMDHSIQIAPLSESRFNHCKSNISWIEATYSGAAMLAPEWHEWKQPGVTTYNPNNTNDFYLNLKAMIVGNDLNAAVDQSREQVRSQFSLMHWNNYRVKLLEELCARS